MHRRCVQDKSQVAFHQEKPITEPMEPRVHITRRRRYTIMAAKKKAAKKPAAKKKAAKKK